jgi:hypothetical protein
VKGHQDDIRHIDELDAWSWWNIKMDESAKLFWKETNQHYINPTRLLGEPWHIEINGKKITSNL